MFLAEDYSSEIRGALAIAWFAFSLYWAAVCGFVATEKGRKRDRMGVCRVLWLVSRSDPLGRGSVAVRAHSAGSSSAAN